MALTGFGRPEDVQRACDEGFLRTPHETFRYTNAREVVAEAATKDKIDNTINESLAIYHLTFIICHFKTFGFRTK